MESLQEGGDVKYRIEEDEEEMLTAKKGPILRDDIIFSSIKAKIKPRILFYVMLILTTILAIAIVVAVLLMDDEKKDYPTYEEILEKLEQTVTRLKSHIHIKTEIIGKSVENRNITLLKMFPKSEYPPNTTDQCSHPLVWVVCGVHAREWTSPLTCLSFIKRIGDIFTSSSPSSDAILGTLQYNILVLANPDGYHYSMSAESHRLARKNRQKSSCPDPLLDGVDINRNFGSGYNHGDDCYGQLCPFNATPCSITHGGKSPFSEPETRAVRDAMVAEVPWLSLSLHGNGNSWTSPFAYKISDPTSTTIPEWDLEFLSDKIVKEFGTQYLYGSSASVMYRAGGTMIDWVFEDLGVIRSYNHELRNLCTDQMLKSSKDDRGLCIFQPKVQLAMDLIIPEAWFGFKELLKHSYQYDCVSKDI